MDRPGRQGKLHTRTSAYDEWTDQGGKGSCTPVQARMMVCHVRSILLVDSAPLGFCTTHKVRIRGRVSIRVRDRVTIRVRVNDSVYAVWRRGIVTVLVVD